VTHIFDSVSLIPYLQKEGVHFYLSLSPEQASQNAVPAEACPFPSLSNSSPFTNLFSASLMNEVEQPILPLTLFVQNDSYPDNYRDLQACNNSFIDWRWQEIFSYYSQKKSAAKPIFLKAQIDLDGGVPAFQPLFFCLFRKAYFSPFCPYCGRPLDLCRDDRVLTEHGLKPYSSTLTRYLFCKNCAETEETAAFYISKKEPDDPDFVVDQADLMLKMGKKLGRIQPAEGILPCTNCGQQQACYGPDSLAISRISVFSFYPFYMLIFNADKIDSSEYQNLASDHWFRPYEGKEKPDDEADSISTVLLRILSKWRTEMATSPNFDFDTENADLAATHIISAKNAAQNNPVKINGTGDNTAIPETRIISGKISNEAAASQIEEQPKKSRAPQISIMGENVSRTHIAGDEGELEKTRIINPKSKDSIASERRSEQTPKRPVSSEIDLEKTILVSKKGKQNQKTDKKER